MNKKSLFWIIALFLIALPIINAEQVNLTKGIISYWDFENITVNESNNLANSTIGGVTIQPGILRNQIGKLGKSVFLNVSLTNYMNSSSAFLYGNSQNLTFNIWVKMDRETAKTAVGSNSHPLLSTRDGTPINGINFGLSTSNAGGFVVNRTQGGQFAAGTMAGGWTNTVFNYATDNYNVWTMNTFIKNKTGWLMYENGIFQTFTADANNLLGGACTIALWGTGSTAGGSCGVPNANFMYGGYFDDAAAWNRVLNQSEITALYNGGIGLSYPFIPTNYFNGSSIPQNGISFNQLFMNFSQNASFLNDTINCTLIINEILNETKQYSNLTNEKYFFKITYDKILSEGEYNYSIYCESIIRNITMNTTKSTFYLDVQNPNFQTNFNNDSFFYVNNITAMINFTDNIYLNSFNISIDGTNIAGNNSLIGTSFQYNLSKSLSTYSIGRHILTISVTDGHPLNGLNNYQQNFTFYKVNVSNTSSTKVYEGSFTTLTLNLSMTNITRFNNSAYLIWNGLIKSAVKTNISENLTNYVSTFAAIGKSPSVNWTWFFNISQSALNLSGNSSFIGINITNCSEGNELILNYTVYDQETQTLPNISLVNITIETDILLTSIANQSLTWDFSTRYIGNNLLICLPNGTLNDSNYLLDATTKYEYSSHVTQYHYIDNLNLSSSAIPKVINLYDLASSKSTSFLITYQNENYIYDEGVVVDLLRKYIYQNGQFLSVEHGRTDSGGQTRLHLTTEDIIYKVNIWKDGVLQYTSGEFFALCQTTPCQINFKKPSGQNASVSDTANIIYSITDDTVFESTEQMIFEFSTKDGSSSLIEMNVSRFSAYDNETICSLSTTTSAGSLVCSIPVAYSNSTYQVKIYKDGKFIGYKSYTLNPRPQIGKNMSMFLAGFSFLTLSMMGITDGIIMIALGLISIIMLSVLFILNTGGIIGIGSSVIWLFVGAAILWYKIHYRRRR